MSYEKHKLEIAIVSGASHALEYKKKNPNASDEEALRHVTNNAAKILEKMEGEEEI